MKTIIFTILGLMLTLNSSHAQVDRLKAPIPGPAPKIQIGDYTKFELPNGLKIFVVENHRLPKVSFGLSFIFDPPLEGANTGIGNMTAELIGTGTKKMTKDQINDEIDFIGAMLNANATGIYASSLKKHTGKILEIFSDVAQNSVFTEKELAKARTQFLSGLASEKDNAESIADKVSSALIYGKTHPYGEFETEATVKNITLEMCNTYYQTYFRPNIAYLSVVGDITPNEAKALIEKYFGNWQKKDVKTTIYPKPQLPASRKVAIVDRPQSVQSTITIGYPVEMNQGNPDFIKAYITNTILGGGVFRLFMNLREKHAYTYGAYSSFSSHPLMGSFNAEANVRNAVTDSAVYQILYEMERIREEPIPASEVALAKNYVTGNFALSLENPQTIASFAVNTERYKLPKDFYSNYLKNIEAVTPADVQAMAKKYILPDKSIILVVGKASEFANKLKTYSPNGNIEYYDFEGNPYDPNKKAASAPAGVTAESILEKYISVAGGKTNIDKIKTCTIKGNFMVQGMSLKINTFYKMPGKFLLEILMNEQPVQRIVLNGDNGKMTGMQGNKELTGVELEKTKLQAELFPEYKYEKLGYKTELMGIENINGKDAYLIQITSPSQSVIKEYYAVESGLKIRTISTDETSDIIEYSTTSGIQFPKKVKVLAGNQSLEVNVDAIEINTDLKDEIFN